jgi:hypothetical protein
MEASSVINDDGGVLETIYVTQSAVNIRGDVAQGEAPHARLPLNVPPESHAFGITTCRIEA